MEYGFTSMFHVFSPSPHSAFPFLSAQSSHSLFRFSYLGKKKTNKHIHRLKSSICGDLGRWHTHQIYWSGIYWRKLGDMSQVCRSLLFIVNTMAQRSRILHSKRTPQNCEFSFNCVIRKVLTSPLKLF